MKMDRSRIFLWLSIVAIAMVWSSLALAGAPKKIEAALLSAYPVAEAHKGVESAQENPDPSKIRSYVVFERGGVPAEQAAYFIEWQDYDYRGVAIALDKGDRMTTRRGSPYTYLQRGDFMIVVGQKYFNDTFYFKLLSVDPYIPENKREGSHYSRVGVMLGFKLPKEIVKADDPDAAVKVVGEWIKPFSDAAIAKQYANSLKAPIEKSAEDKKGAAKLMNEADGNTDQLKALEKKIDDARREMDAASQEIDRLKKAK